MLRVWSCGTVTLVMGGNERQVSLLESSCSLHSAVSGSAAAVRKAKTKQLTPEDY